ncbi:hypothetical protein AgCh_020164 [Apium graveolens]
MPCCDSTKSMNIVHVTALVLLFASLPLGHAVLQPVTNLINVTQVNITGRLVCTSTGNAPTSGSALGAAGVLLGGACSGSSGNINTILTDPNGFIFGIYSLAGGILLNTTQGLPCFLSLQLPLNGTSCQVFPPTGILTAPLQLVGVVLNAAGQLIATATVGQFVHVL